MLAHPEFARSDAWPALDIAGYKDTYATLHLWTQVIGKMPLVSVPWTNHSWHVTLYLTARGLGTQLIPLGARDLQIEFDFIDHILWLRTTDGHVRQVVLRP